MPDKILLAKALALAAAIAVIVVLLTGVPWRSPRWSLATAGGVLGTALGFGITCWWLGIRPNWPPKDAMDRLLFVILPIVVGVELVGAAAGKFRWPVWLLRAIVAAFAARLLIDKSSYIADLSGPDSRLWDENLTIKILAGLAVALAVVWAALLLLLRRPGGRAVPFALAGTCVAAGATVMFSGYATGGGQIGLPLGAAIAGTFFASLLLSGRRTTGGAVSLGVVGLFSYLLIGRLFADLTTTNAALLFFAPLLCWLPEFPLIRRLPIWLRSTLGVLLTVVPVAIALFLAHQKFEAESVKSSSGSEEISPEDYMNFGK
jgi:hypothetical protein